MQLNEHLSKLCLTEFGVPCGVGALVLDAEAAISAAQDLGFPVAVKAQVPASGRGKAGGIKSADNADDVRQRFDQVMSANIAGFVAESVRIEPWRPSQQEVYLAVSFSEEHRGPVLIFSASGGVDVESGAQTAVVALRADGSIDTAALSRAAQIGGLDARVTRRLVELAEALARAYDALDARLIELNPVGIRDNDLIALDARVIIDDNALFRQESLAQRVRESSPRPPEDIERELSGLELVALDGVIGLVSGGAGMTLTAMDMIRDQSEGAACFLDCSANPTKVGYRRALEYVDALPSVSVVLVSIFGGLTRVDKVAKNLCELLASGICSKPVVFRLTGADVSEATAVLAEHGYHNHAQLEDAVAAAVAIAREFRPEMDPLRSGGSK